MPKIRSCFTDLNHEEASVAFGFRQCEPPCAGTMQEAGSTDMCQASFAWALVSCRERYHVGIQTAIKTRARTNSLSSSNSCVATSRSFLGSVRWLGTLFPQCCERPILLMTGNPNICIACRQRAHGVASARYYAKMSRGMPHPAPHLLVLPSSSAYKELGNRSSMDLQLNNRATEEPGVPFCSFIRLPETRLYYRTSATQLHPNPERSTPPWLSNPEYPPRPTPPQATRWQRANPRFNLNS